MTPRRARGVTHEWVRETMLALPGVTEGTSYGTPAFRVGKGSLCRFHQDGESLVVPFDMDDREILMRADPESFYLTDHYRAYPYVLARLATVDRDALRDLLEEVWRRQAPKSKAAPLRARSAPSATRSRGPSRTAPRAPSRGRGRAR